MAGVSLCTIGNAGTLLTYGLGVVLEWRQLAGVLACLALPYIIGLLTCVPNDDNVMIGESSNTFGNSFVSKDYLQVKMLVRYSHLCLFLGSNEKMPKNLIVTQCSNNNQLFGSDKFASALVSSSVSSSQDSIYVQLEKPTLIADRERKGVRQ